MVVKCPVGICPTILCTQPKVGLKSPSPLYSKIFIYAHYKNLNEFLQGSVPQLRTTYPNFVILGSSNLLMLQACYENEKSLFERRNDFKTDSPFTIIAKLFFTRKSSYFVYDKVRAGCLKLGHTILDTLTASNLSKYLL